MNVFGKVLVPAGVACALATPLHAQVLGLNPTPDVAVSYGYPDAIPNGGRARPEIAAVTGFGRVFGYGSSSTNTRNAPLQRDPGSPTGIAGNTPYQYIELLSPQIGGSFRRGNTFPPGTDFADGGATTQTGLLGSPVGCTLKVNCTFQPQIEQFKQTYGGYAPNDLVVHWLGVNDFNNVTSRAILDARVRDYGFYNNEMIRQDLQLGARNIMFLGMSDFGKLANYTRTGDPALLTEATQRVNADSIASLTALHNQYGANIHYFDFDMLVNQIRANPTAYGFSPQGVGANVSCLGNAQANFGKACTSLTFAQQNSFLSYDGLHWTYRYHDIMSLAIANQLIAPYTIAPQGEIADVSARAFGNSLLLRLDAYRAQNTPALVPAAYTADLPGRAAPPVPMAVLLGNPVSLFAEGGYANGSRERRVGAPGFDYEAPSVTVGAEYRARPDLLLGAAFNYSNASTNLTSLGALGATRIDVDTYQFAGFASLNRPDWFADLVVGYGFNDFAVSRAGLLDRLSATPRAETLLVAAKAAYLFDLGAVRVGPVGTLTYAHTWIDAYREQGDPLLTQAVGRQARDGLTGGAGLQVRLPVAFGERVLSPFVNLTAEHDFLGQLRTITTAQTYALTLPIATAIRGYDGGTYGKVAAGLSIDLGGGLSGMINGAATFARANGDDFAVNGGLRYRY